IYDGPRFRFHPTDEEILCFYLKRKLTENLPPTFDHLVVIDIYKFESFAEAEHQGFGMVLLHCAGQEVR
ncbi:hypothetical protein RYX36_030608, partial [Vicia faba]